MTDMRNNKSQMAETETNNTKTLKEIFSEEIRAELASGRTKKPTFEEFKEMVEKEKSKRRKKYTAIAACFVVALVVGFFAFDMMADDVGADKNPKEIIQTEDGVIIEDGGWGSFVVEGEQVILTDWEEVEDTKQAYPQIKMPAYIPDGYKFDQLVVENVEDEATFYEYIFVGKEKDLLEIEFLMMDGGAMSSSINDYSKKYKIARGTVFVENNKKATISLDDGIVVNIWHNISEEELIKTIESIK